MSLPVLAILLWFVSGSSGRLLYLHSAESATLYSPTSSASEKGPQLEAAGLRRPQSIHLEIKLRAELNDARAAVPGVSVRILAKTAAHQASAAGRPSVDRQSCWRCAARRVHGPIQINILEIRMVEHIESLEPELYGMLFVTAQLNVFEQ